MIPLPDGTFRFSPRDLVAYLEGDFAAWCERMHAERGRAGGAGSAELEWATPDEGDEEAALAARKGEEHEQRYLGRAPGARARDLVEITRDDPGGRAHPRRHARPAPRSSTRPTSSPTAGTATPTSSSAAPATAAPAAATTTPPGTPSSPAPPSPTSWSSSAPTPTCSRRSGASGPTELVFVLGHGRRAAVPDPTTSSTTTASSSARSSPSRPTGSVSRVPDPGLDRSWGRWEDAAEKLLAAVRPPEPGRQHHPGPGAPAGGGRRSRRSPRWPAASAVAACRRISDAGASSGSAPRPGSSSSRAACPQPLWELRPPVPDEPRRGLALLPPPSRRRRLLRHGGLPLRRGRAGVPVRRGDRWTRSRPCSTTGGPTTRARSGRRSRGSSTGSWRAGGRIPTLHIYHYASYEETARQAAHGEVRHPRSRGGRSAPARRVRGPLRRRAAGLRDRHAELLAQGRSSASTCRRATASASRPAARWSSTSGGSTAASRGGGRSRRS